MCSRRRCTTGARPSGSIRSRSSARPPNWNAAGNAVTVPLQKIKGWSTMNGRAFKLGTFAKTDGKPFAAIVLDDTAFDLAQAAGAAGRKLGGASLQSISLQDLLDDWERNFATLR